MTRYLAIRYSYSNTCGERTLNTYYCIHLHTDSKYLYMFIKRIDKEKIYKNRLNFNGKKEKKQKYIQ